MGKIHKPNRRAFLPCPPVFTNTSVLQQYCEDMAVILNQTGTGKACGKLFYNLFHLVIIHPIVDDLELSSEHWQHDHFGKILPKGITWALLAVEVDDFPAKAVKLVEKGFLDVVALVEPEALGSFILSHTIHPSVV